jgi:predicted transcriptional regulator
MKSILVLSIRDRHANDILDGTKTVELRKTRPRLVEGDIVLIYVPKPIMAVVGGFEVKNVVSTDPKNLWKKVGSESGLTRKQFTDYYSGSSIGFGIRVAKTWRLAESLSLKTLRRWWPEFCPPQGFRYLRASEINTAITLSMSLLPKEINPPNRIQQELHLIKV